MVIQGIIQEFIWVSVLTWASPCDANFAAGGLGLTAPLPLILLYTFLDSLTETPLLLKIYSIFSVLNLKLGAQTNYPLAWMFFFHTPATAFPTTYRMKTVPSQCFFPNAEVLIERNWKKSINRSALEKKPGKVARPC